MHYALLFLETEANFSERDAPATGPAYMGAWMDYIGAMRAAGIMRAGSGLQAPHTATTLRLQDGKRHVQDGPFADTKEMLGGFVVIDVPDLDAALDWAARAPCAGSGGVEVRPELPPMPGPG